MINDKWKLQNAKCKMQNRSTRTPPCSWSTPVLQVIDNHFTRQLEQLTIPTEPDRKSLSPIAGSSYLALALRTKSLNTICVKTA